MLRILLLQISYNDEFDGIIVATLRTDLSFYARQLLSRVKKHDRQRFLPARRYASAGNSDRNVSVRLSVCHAPVLCQNEES